jgi:hypothetical protein
MPFGGCTSLLTSDGKRPSTDERRALLVSQLFSPTQDASLSSMPVLWRGCRKGLP